MIHTGADIVESIRPRHPLVKEIIDNYYFQRVLIDDFQQSYIYYPNFGHCINVYLGASVEWDDSKRVLRSAHPEEGHCILTTTYQHSRMVQMYGKQVKLGIIFKPLGLNYLLEPSIAKWCKETVARLDVLEPTFLTLARKVMTYPNLNQRADILDNFFLRHYRPFTEDRIKQAVSLVFEHRTGITAKDIAQQLDISRKTLLRLFHKHIGYAYRDFSAVVKFRLALNQYMTQSGQTKLFDLAFDNAYFDHAHLVHHFQDVAGLSPSTLFKGLRVRTDGIYWGKAE